MKFLPAMLTLAFTAAVGAHGGAVLDYRVKVRLRDDSAWSETRFRLVTTPALVTRNKVKKPRMGTWRVEAGRGPAPGAAVLARVRGLLYFSGPTAQTLRRESGMRVRNRWCRLWQAQAPEGVPAYAYLVEVAPNLLALSYLSASLPEGDIAALEIHLEDAALGARPSPAEDGTALLHTLQRWGSAPPPAQAMLTEEVQ